MPVVARHRAEEFDLALLPPGSRSAVYADQESANNTVIHKAQTGLPAHDNIFLLQTEEVGKKLLALIHAGKLAVVANIRTLTGNDELRGILTEYTHGKIKLDGIGFTAGHIELFAERRKLVVFFGYSRKLLLELRPCHVGISLHGDSSFIH